MARALELVNEAEGGKVLLFGVTTVRDTAILRESVHRRQRIGSRETASPEIVGRPRFLDRVRTGRLSGTCNIPSCVLLPAPAESTRVLPHRFGIISVIAAVDTGV